MTDKKKKPSVVLLVIGALLAAYFGYLVNGAWTKGMDISEFMDSINKVLANPIADYYKGAVTVKAVLMAILIYAVMVTMYYTSQRNLMPGKEYGTAKFADLSQINRILRDKDDKKNRILSQNVRMSLDTRKTKLNNNVLIIGGSGAGKTFYEVKPNLMQMPDKCSFIVTDPKGEILRSTGEMLKNNGYNVKVINLIDMEQSD